jgi:hypothetical protein
MVFSQIRDYLHELRSTLTRDWQLYSKYGETTTDPSDLNPDIDLRRLNRTYRQRDIEAQLTSEYKQHYTDTRYGFEESNHLRGYPFEFYTPDDSPPPEKRQPAPGLRILPVRLHKEQVVTATESVPETGYPLHPLLEYLLSYKYPRYYEHSVKYNRPLGTTDATFEDFNREQIRYPDVPKTIIDRILPLVCIILGAKPFLPLHWIDTFFTKMPLITGVSYFYRHSYELRTHAAFSHPKDYANRQTSKGYFINAFSEWSRHIVHHIKDHGLPFSIENLTNTQILERLRSFFIEHATSIYTRNQISERNGPQKQRPIYAMDTLFLHLECMVTFPLHVMARSIDSAIMYSFETIRGGCAFMDQQAKKYRSYLCIDWSSFDQRMPWIIVDTFFTCFLPFLLIINAGYHPTAEYPTYPDLTADKLFHRLFNILCFLRLWYYNCVFYIADGFAYIRMFAGIASGMLNTQYLDSYCNLFLMIHGLIHFGCTDDEILQICFFVMGDDNVLLTHWPLHRLNTFLDWFEQHALSRFGMVLSRKKSLITQIRTRIEMLGYQCNAGAPKRSIPKLVAQLCFPERGLDPRYMSSRAIGMAFAAAGSDPMFHSFCKDVYWTFKPYEPEIFTEADELRLQKDLPGYLKYLATYEPDFKLDHLSFPSIHDVRSRYATWQGELNRDSKWNPSHFLKDPDYAPNGSITMQQFMDEHSINFPDVPDVYAF